VEMCVYMIIYGGEVLELSSQTKKQHLCYQYYKNVSDQLVTSISVSA